jgi:ABC-type nitrate/sulfonate/bicarbonate transport system permease component
VSSSVTGRQVEDASLHGEDAAGLLQAQRERGLARLAERLRAAAITAAPPVAVLALFFISWEVYVSLANVSHVTLPAPSRIFESASNNRELLLSHSLVTTRIAVFGLGVSIVFAVALALLIDAVAPARRALYPLIVGSQTVPIVVLAPLLILWFGFELTPKIVVVALYTFFPITVAFASGLAATDVEARLLMRTLGAGRLQMLRLLQIPQALPYFFTGLRISVTYAMVGAVFAEWSGAREGLGIYVLLMKNAFRTDMVFAAIFLIALISLALFLLVGLVEKLVVRWR